MKQFTWLAFLLLAACSGGTEPASYRKAEDALDAGREYVNACLQGDFSKAAFYTIADEPNRKLLQQTENSYREKDKEGRQQLRNASINIHEVKDLTDSTTEIHYSNSFDKTAHTLQVVKRDQTWAVDLGKSQ
ncbi:MAG: hypothetical protein HYU71_02090 [Bacteroidetes bacterium]|nr:hypothetical protein [Bacteroidota bacterium]